MIAEIAETGGAEHGVGHRVAEGVGVAVAHQARAARDGDPTQDQGPVGVVAEGVDVVALPDPQAHRHPAFW